MATDDETMKEKFFLKDWYLVLAANENLHQICKPICLKVHKKVYLKVGQRKKILSLSLSQSQWSEMDLDEF